MSLEANVPEEPLRFILKNSDPATAQELLIQASTDEEKQELVNQIKSVLDKQLNFIKAIQHPIAYQKALTTYVAPQSSAVAENGAS